MQKILKNFIVFEGIDGSGTTTQCKLLSEHLNRKEISHRVDCEPTTGPIGKLIRQTLGTTYDFLPYTIAALFTADRNEHIFAENGVEELTKAGSIVISDRYLFSTLAYQSNENNIETLKHLNMDFPLPEYLFYFKIDTENAFERINKRGSEKEIYENLAFLEKVTTNYNNIIEEYRDSGMKIVVIDALLPIEEIRKKIESYFN